MNTTTWAVSYFDELDLEQKFRVTTLEIKENLNEPSSTARDILIALYKDTFVWHPNELDSIEVDILNMVESNGVRALHLLNKDDRGHVLFVTAVEIN